MDRAARTAIYLRAAKINQFHEQMEKAYRERVSVIPPELDEAAFGTSLACPHHLRPKKMWWWR